MAFIPVPNVAQLNFGYVADLGWTWSNGLHFYKTGGWTTSELQVLAETAADAWAELADGIFGTNCNLQKTTAIDLSDEAGAYYENVLGTPTPGTRSGDALPLNVAMTVTLRTAQRGRSYRGRIYHYGLSNTDRQTEKQWQTSVAVTVQNAYDAVIDAIVTETLADHVVVSRYENGSPRTLGISTDVTAVVARLKVATQRRRLNQ